MKKFGPWAAAACMVMMGASPAWALYKVVGPDGKVSYTDRPPQGAEGKAVPMDRDSREAANPNAALPFALRAPAARFPVTLYTTTGCEPCERGRQLLRQRGVPYRERTATSDADRAAWLQVTGSAEAPALAIGNQMLHGLEENSWNRYLDAAGYPRQSLLPASYTPAPPQPLVSSTATPAPASEAAPPTPAAAQPPAPPASGSFRF